MAWSLRTFAAIAAFNAIVVTGCSSSPPPDLSQPAASLNSAEPFITSVSKNPQKAKLLASPPSMPPPAVVPPSSGAPAELTAFLQGTIQRIMAQSPWPSRPVAAVVSDCPVFTDELQPNGALKFCVETFRHLGSESEIAFMVSHEISHVLLRHTEGDQQRAAEQNKEIQTTYFFLGPNGRTSAETKFANINASLKRSQEQEADLLGLDLLVKAGFNPNGAYTFFDLKRRSRLAKASYRDVNELEQKRRLDQSIREMKDITDLGVVTAKAITNAADNAIMSDLNDDDHKSAASRMDAVAQYIRTHYQAETSRPLGKQPWKSQPARFAQTNRLFASASP